METLPVPLAVLAALAALVLAYLVASTLGLLAVGASEARKTRRLEREARRDWEHRTSDPAVLERFQGGPFGLGTDATATHVFRGVHEGRSFVAFDHAVTVDGTRHCHAVVAVDVHATCPPLSMAPRRWPVPLFEEVAGESVQIDHFSLPEVYDVRSPDPEFARALLVPLAIQQLLSWPALAWRLADGALVVVRPSEHDDALQVQRKLSAMTLVLDGASLR